MKQSIEEIVSRVAAATEMSYSNRESMSLLHQNVEINQAQFTSRLNDAYTHMNRVQDALSRGVYHLMESNRQISRHMERISYTVPQITADIDPERA